LVIIGGLFTSTLLNLFVTPSLYLRFGGPRQHDRRSWRRLWRRAAGPEPA
jgi:hypothetical protein